MRIKQMGPDDRPRERLILSGASTLSNAELIAIILRSGTSKANALDIARGLLADNANSLSELSARSVGSLCRHSGIGPGKAVSILAALELGRRSMREKTGGKGALCSASKVYEYMLPILKGRDKELLYAIYLNRLFIPKACEQIAEGNETSLAGDPGAIARKALEIKASKVILIHNHPSGDPSPSRADIEHTRLLQRTLSTLGLNLTDHVIISDSGYYSFAEDSATVR